MTMPALTCAVLARLRDDVPTSSAALVLVVWVVAAAATGDRWAGVLAAASASAGFDYFLTVPYHSFKIDNPDDLQVAVLLVVIGIAVNEIALWGRRQRAQSSQRAGYLEAIADVASAAAAAGTPVEVAADAVAMRIAEVLGADECRFVAGPVHDVRIAMLDRDGTVTRDGTQVNVDRSGLPIDEYVAIAVGTGAAASGHFLITASTRVRRPSREHRRVATLLADQVGAALAASRRTG